MKSLFTVHRGPLRTIASLPNAIRTCALVSCAALFVISPALADDEDVDDLMGGFDDDFDVSILEDLEEEMPAWIAALPGGKILYERVELSGSIAAGAVWNYLSHTVPDGHGAGGRTDYGGLSRLDLDGFLQLDIELPGDWQIRAEALGWYDFVYRIQGRNGYNGAVLDVYEWQVDSGEVYLTGPLHENVDITAGRKIVNWGRSDTFRVVDVINPLDQKEPGLVDIEDLRRPVVMVKLDATAGPWSAQFMVIPEHRYDRLPPPGSDFYPEALASGPFARNIETNRRSDFTGTPGLAGKIDGRFSGWDFSIYGAYVDENSFTLDFEPTTGLRFEPNRIGMFGAGANYTRGPWLVKAEFAWLSNYSVLRIDPIPPGGVFRHERDRIDSMIGIEYYGPDQLTIALEIVNRHFLKYPGNTALLDVQEQSNFETGLRISRPFFRERLDVTLLGLAFGEDLRDGGIFRASADFELTDSWKLEGGWIVYFGGPRDGLGSFDSNDRIFAEVKYSF